MMLLKVREFHKSLAKFYHGWFRDCHDSAVYCVAQGLNGAAAQYEAEAKVLFDIINENWNAIEFFSIGDRAFLYDEVLPVEFQGYK